MYVAKIELANMIRMAQQQLQVFENGSVNVDLAIAGGALTSYAQKIEGAITKLTVLTELEGIATYYD